VVRSWTRRFSERVEVTWERADGWPAIVGDRRRWRTATWNGRSLIGGTRCLMEDEME
jgi:hypothetical protein